MKFLLVSITVILSYFSLSSLAQTQAGSQNTQLDSQSMAQISQMLNNNPELSQSLAKALGTSAIQDSQAKTPEKIPPLDFSDDKTGMTKNQQDLYKQFQAKQQRTTKNTDTTPTAEQLEAQIPTHEEMNKNAYEAVSQKAFPLSTEQIKDLHAQLDETQRATAAGPLDQSPQPTSSSLVVNLSPGSTPPVIRLYRGFVSSLVFVDSTGGPWPIAAYDLGNPNAFDIQWNTKDNTLMVQARTSYTYGNLAVKLQNLNTPVMLTLVPGQKAVDYRVDLRVAGIGPNAKQTYSGSGMPATTSPLLLNILDGIAPKGAKRLQVQGNNTDAWLYNNKLYLRTPYKLMSPAWFSTLSSADGMNAYELPKTPLALLARHGKTVQMKFTGL